MENGLALGSRISVNPRTYKLHTVFIHYLKPCLHQPCTSFFFLRILISYQSQTDRSRSQADRRKSQRLNTMCSDCIAAVRCTNSYGSRTNIPIILAIVVRTRTLEYRTNSYDCHTNSYGNRATIARHTQHLSDICPSPKSFLISYVVRTAAVRILTADMRSKKNRKQIARKMGMSKSPCDVTIDRTALRIRTTAVRSLANSLRFQSQANPRL